jgi:peptide/nickel transport system ATP-binding protein
VVGESGSGKSSLIQLMLGLQKPSSGRVRFEGRDPTGLDAKSRRRLQAVFQDVSAALNPRWSIRASLSEPLEIHGLPRDDSALAAILDRVGLSSQVLGSRPQLLSLGQRQRINIARALSLSPHLLLLDEPVSSLDVTVQGQILNVLQGLPSSTTMVMVTHDVSVAAHFSTRLAVMHEGHLVESGFTADLLSNAKHLYTQKLLALHRAAEAPAELNLPLS